MRFALCCTAGQENLYIREWVEHHIRQGFDKIIIYTTVPNENPQHILFDYVVNGIVDIIPWYPQNKDKIFQDDVQCPAYNDCLERYKDSFDWIAFFDVDEFLDVYCGNIHTWFSSMPVLDQCDSVIVNWYAMDSNGKLYYEDKPVQERFTHHKNFKWIYPGAEYVDCIFKSIVNTKTTKRFKKNPHMLYGLCGAEEDKLHVYTTGAYMMYASSLFGYSISNPDFSHAKLKHYRTKSLIEYLSRKLGNGWNAYGITPEYTKESFMAENEWTREHEFVFNVYVNNLKNKE
jgi:hypothetical protein